MRRSTKWNGSADELEGRALLSTGGGVWSNPAVQADLAKIQADQKTFQTDLRTLAPTLQKDQQAIQAAIKNAIANDSSVQTAQTTLSNDEAAARTTLRNDLKAFGSATSGSARMAALKVYFNDLASTAKTIAADAKAVQAAIDADSGVQAAEAQLKTDAAPIAADESALQADYTQLAKDIQAALAAVSPAVRHHG